MDRKISKEEFYQVLSGSLNVYRSYLDNDENIIDEEEYDNFQENMDKYDLQLAWPYYYLEEYLPSVLIALTFISKLAGLEFDVNFILDPEDFIKKLEKQFKSMPKFDQLGLTDRDQTFIKVFLIDNSQFLNLNIKAIKRFGHSNSINNLINTFLEHRDEVALLNAISIDNRIQELPDIQEYIKARNVIGDKVFLKNLSSANQGIPSTKTEKGYDELRLIDSMIQDMKNIEPLSGDDLEEIYIKRLKLYFATGKQPKASLLKFLRGLKVD